MISSKHFISENLHQSTQTIHTQCTNCEKGYFFFFSFMFSAIPQIQQDYLQQSIIIYSFLRSFSFTSALDRKNKYDHGLNPYIAAYNPYVVTWQSRRWCLLRHCVAKNKDLWHCNIKAPFFPDPPPWNQMYIPFKDKLLLWIISGFFSFSFAFQSRDFCLDSTNEKGEGGRERSM